MKKEKWSDPIEQQNHSYLKLRWQLLSEFNMYEKKKSLRKNKNKYIYISAPETFNFIIELIRTVIYCKIL